MDTRYRVTGDATRNERNEDDEGRDDADALHNHSTGASISRGGFVRTYGTYLHLA